MPAEAVVAALRRTWQALEPLNLPMALAGGLALSAWNHIRSTTDVDLLIALTGVRTPSLLASLSAAGLRAKRTNPLIRLEDGEFIQLFYEPPDAFVEIQIDLIIATTEFHTAALARRVPLFLPALGFEVNVLACEDLVVMKLLAGRILDRVDAARLLEANRDAVDLDYLKNWLTTLRLVAPFREAWSDAFANEPPPF